jgi:hypothetical protein
MEPTVILIVPLHDEINLLPPIAPDKELFLNSIAFGDFFIR